MLIPYSLENYRLERSNYFLSGILTQKAAPLGILPPIRSDFVDCIKYCFLTLLLCNPSFDVCLERLGSAAAYLQSYLFVSNLNRSILTIPPDSDARPWGHQLIAMIRQTYFTHIYTLFARPSSLITMHIINYSKLL